MKTALTLIALFTILLLLVNPLAAQDKMSKDEWQAQMTTAKTRVAQLQGQLARLDSDKASLQTQSSKLDADLRACEDALYAMLGITRADAEAFDKELSDMEKRVDDLQKMSDAELATHRDEIERMDARLKELAGHKMAMIPRYKNRVTALQDRVTALLKSITKEKSYTVGTWSRDRDCLWNIAKKKDIYANAWMWPKIWQGNRDKIKDPDRIKPKWVLKIPEGNEMSKEEKSAANRYYRKKASSPGGQ
ncbi:MAG: LysM peptidoglycan-binding domain-containing protein [Ignavibacteriae bacterium]|nr:LysM peptidoglycan-binding domain-containing protein [Ignavibacteriota bacterium]